MNHQKVVKPKQKEGWSMDKEFQVLSLQNKY